MKQKEEVKTISFRLSNSLYDELSKKANKNYMTPTTYLRHILLKKFGDIDG